MGWKFCVTGALYFSYLHPGRSPSVFGGSLQVETVKYPGFLFEPG